MVTCKQYDVICLSGLFLESTDNRLNIRGYNLTSAEFLGNKKEEGSICTKKII